MILKTKSNKRTNKKNKQKLTDPDNSTAVTRGQGVGRTVNTVTEDLTLGGRHTMQYTDDVSQNCILETYVVLPSNVTPTKKSTFQGL